MPAVFSSTTPTATSTPMAMRIFASLTVNDDKDEGSPQPLSAGPVVDPLSAVAAAPGQGDQLSPLPGGAPAAGFLEADKVTAVRTENKRQALGCRGDPLFLASITDLGNQGWLLREIERLLMVSRGLIEPARPAFPGQFNTWSVYAGSRRDLRDLLRTVFNNRGAGRVHVDLIRGPTVEIVLRVGDHDPFGVINVGDAVPNL